MRASYYSMTKAKAKATIKALAMARYSGINL